MPRRRKRANVFIAYVPSMIKQYILVCKRVRPTFTCVLNRDRVQLPDMLFCIAPTTWRENYVDCWTRHDALDVDPYHTQLSRGGDTCPLALVAHHNLYFVKFPSHGAETRPDAHTVWGHVGRLTRRHASI